MARKTALSEACFTWIISLTCVVLIGGCGGRDWETVRKAALYPADFAVSVHVQSVAAAPDTTAPTPLDEPAQYIFEPNRTLRVAVGPGTTTSYYPRKTRTLHPDEMLEVYQLVTAAQAEAALPAAGISASRYTVEYTAREVRQRFVTEPTRGPNSRALAESLVRWRGAE